MADKLEDIKNKITENVKNFDANIEHVDIHKGKEPLVPAQIQQGWWITDEEINEELSKNCEIKNQCTSYEYIKKLEDEENS